MTEIRSLELARLEVREDAGSAPGLGGYGVVWGQVAQGTEFGAEAFAPGSFRDAIAAQGDKPIPFLDRHDGEVIGVLRAAEDDTGLALDGRLFASSAAASWRERQAAGIDGASMEFAPGRASRTAAGVTLHRMVGRLVAVAASYKPAHTGARLSLRDMEDTMTLETPAPPDPKPTPVPPTPDPEPGVSIADVQGIVHREVGELSRRISERGGLVHAEDAWALVRDVPNLGALVHRVLIEQPTNTELRGILARALADQLTSESPGVMAPSVLQDVKGIVSAARPGVDSFGREPLTGSGMSVDWPYVTVALSTIVGEQLTQKSEITSVDVPILKGTTGIRTFAGGSDVSYQLIRRSSPAYLDALERIYLAAYAVVTDAAFVNAIEATAGLSTVTIDFASATPNAIQSAMFAASVKVQDATGEPASFVLAAADVFGAIGGALTPQPVQNAVGNASASTLAPVLSGLAVRYDAAVDAGTALISNRRAAAWHEDGPFFATEEDVARLGRNVAVWGMGAAAVYIPAGIVKTATVGTTRSSSASK